MAQSGLTKNYDIALLLIRIGVGIIFIVAGWGKLTGIEGAQAFFGDIGIPLAGVMAWVVAIVEFFGGIMVLAGIYIRVPAVLLAIIMVVAIFTVKLPDGFQALRLDLMLMLAALALALAGSGAYSVKAMMAGDSAEPSEG